MNGKILRLSALIIAATFAFAFKTESGKALGYRYFQLVPEGNKYEPEDYLEVYNLDSCLGTSVNICVIDLFYSDVYTLTEAILAGVPQWADRPKVNVWGSQLQLDLATASASSTDPMYINGRAYFKRTSP
jgi:hypothetical protein